MKQLIVPVATIIALIAFFVIIDRKEFSRHDDVQTVKARAPRPIEKPLVSVPETKPVTESKPAVETKPVAETKPLTESKPKTDVKPTETKPEAETKPAEAKPVAETKPAETKPAEVKPVETKAVETKPVAQAKPEEKLLPTAVPVVTEEEAEKLNAEALLDFDNLIKAFSAKASDMNVLEGKISSISSCPDPATIDYPDCNLTVSVVLNDDNHTEIVLIIPCIRETKRILSPSIKDNAIVRFRIKDEMDISYDEKSIQISDDILDFDLEYYYVDYAVSIVSFSGKTKFIKRNKAKKTIDPQLILTEKDIQTRNKYLKNELTRLNKLIDDYSKEDANIFRENLLEFSKGIGENNFPYIEVGTKDDFPKKVFPLDANIKPPRYLSSACSFNTERLYANAQIVASIRDFLKEKGIHLIVIPVPQSVEAFVDRFNLSPHLSTYNIDRVLFMKYLLEMDVETLDIEPFIEENLLESFYYHNHPNNNVHFTSGGDFYFAQHIFDHVKQYDYSTILCKNEFVGKVKWSNYKVTYNNMSFKEMKNASIISNDKPINNHSPILLIGDSFTRGSLRNSLAHVFTTPISAINATAASTIMPRILQMRENEIPQETKVCFFVFYSYYLGEHFASFINRDSIQIYPDDSNKFVFPDFNIEGKDLQEELSIDLSLDLSSYVSDAQTYTLFFYLSSTSRQNFFVSINSSFRGEDGSRGSGHGVVSVGLTKEALQKPLSINVKTIPDTTGAPLNQNINLLLKIDKILFSRD